MSAVRVRRHSEGTPIVSIEILSRTSPNCPFYAETKKIIRLYVPEASVAEYNAAAFPNKWKEIVNSGKKVKSLPQITLIMKNGERKHVGGYEELKEMFMGIAEETA